MHKSTISKNINLLYSMEDPSLYTHYSAGNAYPSTNYQLCRKEKRSLRKVW
jgi:hypothetical protein